MAAAFLVARIAYLTKNRSNLNKFAPPVKRPILETSFLTIYFPICRTIDGGAGSELFAVPCVTQP